jgi:phosphate transport system substrate-binding protein
VDDTNHRESLALPMREIPSRLPWLGVLTVLLALVIGGMSIVLGLDDGPIPPFLQSGASSEHDASLARRTDGVMRITGSGSNLPTARALANAFSQDGRPRPVVHPSIGSGGGIRALLDGVIDVALISRPLTPHEREQGLVSVPYARMPVFVAVNGEVPDRGLAAQDLIDIFAGERRMWSDGSRIVVLQREQGDSSHAAVAAAVPGFAEVNELAYREGRWRVLYHDAAMRDALASTEGSLGLHGSGDLPEARFRALVIDGVTPTIGNVASGVYPFTKELAFVTRGTPKGAAAELIELAHSPRGHELILEHGAVPLGPNGEASIDGVEETPD